MPSRSGGDEVTRKKHVFLEPEAFKAAILELNQTQEDLELLEVGRSIEGRPIHCLKLGYRGAKSNILLLGGLHAREWIGPHALLQMMRRILRNVNQPALAALLAHTQLHVLPQINPDGFAYSWTVLGDKKDEDRQKLRTGVPLFPRGSDPGRFAPRFWRQNRRRCAAGAGACGVDLNRNFGHEGLNWGQGVRNPSSKNYQGRKGFSEPEAACIARYAAGLPSGSITWFLDVHCCGPKVMAPFALKPYPPAEADVYERNGAALVHAMSEAVGRARYSYERRARPRPRFSSGIATGWALTELGVNNSYTIELKARGHVTSAAQIPFRGRELYSAVRLALLESATRGGGAQQLLEVTRDMREAAILSHRSTPGTAAVPSAGLGSAAGSSGDDSGETYDGACGLLREAALAGSDDGAGGERRYMLLVPCLERLRGLVVVLHGFGSGPRQMSSAVELEKRASLYGFAAVAPFGTGSSWSAVECCGAALLESRDDVGFLRALVEGVRRSLGASLLPTSAPVVAVGHSNGGFMASHAASEVPTLFSAYVSLSGHVYQVPVAAAPVPVLLIHSTDDPVVLYEGCCKSGSRRCCCGIGATLDACTAAPVLLGRLASRNRCGTRSIISLEVPPYELDGGSLKCSSRVGCEANATLCTLSSAGHFPMNTPAVVDVVWEFIAAATATATANSTAAELLPEGQTSGYSTVVLDPSDGAMVLGALLLLLVGRLVCLFPRRRPTKTKA